MSVQCDRRLPGRRQACGHRMIHVSDMAGRLTWICSKCAHVDQGNCWQCARPRQKLRATFCSACAAERRRQASTRQEASPERQRQKRIRDRRRNKTEARRAWRAQWRAENPDKIRQYKRREGLNPTPAKRARERYWNAQPERQEKKRQHALAAYYAAHPERPNPSCRDCGVAIPYTPPGRPRTRCNACVPASEARRRRLQEAA